MIRDGDGKSSSPGLLNSKQQEQVRRRGEECSFPGAEQNHPILPWPLQEGLGDCGGGGGEGVIYKDLRGKHHHSMSRCRYMSMANSVYPDLAWPGRPNGITCISLDRQEKPTWGWSDGRLTQAKGLKGKFSGSNFSHPGGQLRLVSSQPALTPT
jgi:hypothetical protein